MMKSDQEEDCYNYDEMKMELDLSEDEDDKSYLILEEEMKYRKSKELLYADLVQRSSEQYTEIE